MQISITPEELAELLNLLKQPGETITLSDRDRDLFIGSVSVSPPEKIDPQKLSDAIRDSVSKYVKKSDFRTLSTTTPPVENRDDIGLVDAIAPTRADYRSLDTPRN